MNVEKYIKKEKEALFRAKTEGPKQIWVEGGYFKHINRTICPMGDELTELDVDHLIIQSGFSDWNMPRAVNCYHVIGGTVCECTGRADEDGKKVFTKDIVKTGEGIGVIGWDQENLTFIIYLVNNNSRTKIRLSCLNKIEKVLGNAIDNPELLVVGDVPFTFGY